MLISNILNDSFGLLSKQLRFYCWHFRRNLDARQRQELIDLLYEQHFERLANKIKLLTQSTIADSKQQIGKLLFDHCLTRNRRFQLIQLIESRLVDINVRLDNYGRTLLHRSAYNLDVELVRLLIEQGVNIRLRDYAGNTALHIAIQSYRNGAVIYGNGHEVVKNLTTIITLLLEADKSLQDERSKRKKMKLIHKQSEQINSIRSSLVGKVGHRKESESMDHQYNAMQKPTSVGCSKNYSSSMHSITKSTIKTAKNLAQDHDNSMKNDQRNQEIAKQIVQVEDSSSTTIDPLLLEDMSNPLVDTRNAFGRTALHYCVLVVGEQYLDHFVKLLISFGADTDAIDTRMKTPLYCLVKRAGVSAIREKCMAITHLLDSGCDDLGLAIDPRTYFTNELIKNVEQNISTILQTSKSESPPDSIFTNNSFKRIPSLKHLVRLRLIKLNDEKRKLKRQTSISLPYKAPASLNLYVNRRILDQSELF